MREVDNDNLYSLILTHQVKVVNIHNSHFILWWNLRDESDLAFTGLVWLLQCKNLWFGFKYALEKRRVQSFCWWVYKELKSLEVLACGHSVLLSYHPQRMKQTRRSRWNSLLFSLRIMINLQYFQVPH